MSRWPYKSGDSLAICDICGFRGYRNDMKRTHENLIVHDRCFDPRHPQETIQLKADNITIKDPRPEGPDVFLNPGDVTAASL